MSDTTRTAFIGGGNMAEALIKGMLQGSGIRAESTLVSEPRSDRREYLEKTYRVHTTSSNIEAAGSSNLVILAVKPQSMEEVLHEISSAVDEHKTVMSIAAGITIPYLSSRLRTRKIIRVMPNTPALVQKGMSVMSLCECFSDPAVSVARDILMSVGDVVTLPEKYMDAVTALSGSGPAFIALFLEAMIEGGVKLGLSGEDARRLAVQTAAGTAKLLETGMPPSRLREMVTSPGGTTAAGLTVFTEKGLRETVISAMEAAHTRSGELGGTT